MSLADAKPDPDTPEPSEPERGADTLAVIDLGATKIAVSVVHVREVVPCPAEFEPMPAVERGCLGCFALRDHVIPVVDLPCFLDLADEDDPKSRKVVVILTYEKMLVGVVARSAIKLVKTAECQTHAVRYNTSARSSRIMGKMLTDKTLVLPLLDIAELYSEQIPLTSDTQRGTLKLDHSDRFLLFETDNTKMCLPITRIEATVPVSEVNKWTARSNLCCGTIKSHWYDLALLDPTTLLGLSATSKDVNKASAIVLRLNEDDVLALRIDKVLDIIQISAADLGPTPESVYEATHLIRGVVSRGNDNQFIVLDFEAMTQDPQISGLGKVAVNKRAQIAEARVRKDEGFMSLLVDAGKPCAIDLNQVREIVPWQGNLGKPNDSGYVSGISHRNEMLPIYCLSKLLSLDSAGFNGQSAIVVVSRKGKRIGLMVQSLIAVEVISPYNTNSTMVSKMARRLTRSTVNLFEVVDPETLNLSKFGDI